MGAVFGDGCCSAEAAGGVDVHQGGERAANDFLCCLDYSVQPLPVCSSTAAIPDSDAICQQALYG